MLARPNPRQVLRTSYVILSAIRHLSPYSTIHTKPKMLLLLDWDETLTTHDTLAQIAPPSGSHKGPEFKWYSEAYMSDYSSHVEKWQSPRTIAEQLKFLDSLSEVELKSNTRIEEGGLFVGWDPLDAARRAREQVTLRQGVKDELRQFVRDHSETVEVGVISVSWSSVFIKAGLGVDSVREEEQQSQHSDAAFPLHYLRSNTLELDPKTNLGTGKMSKSGTHGVRTGLDKLREMQRILEVSSRPQVTVYAGDSTTDLPCLLYASVGIIVGDNSSLKSTLDRLGLGQSVVEGLEGFERRLDKDGNGVLKAVQSMDNALERVQNKSAAEFLLVRVRDWREGTRVLQKVLDVEAQSQNP